MARELVVLALVFSGIVYHALAAYTAFAPMPSDGSAASSPEADNTVGEIDDGPGGAGSSDDAVAGPVGGPVPDGAFGKGANGPSTGLGSSGAASIGGVSAFVAIGGVVAGYFL